MLFQGVWNECEKGFWITNKSGEPVPGNEVQAIP